jgi:hypothetical protein
MWGWWIGFDWVWVRNVVSPGGFVLGKGGMGLGLKCTEGYLYRVDDWGLFGIYMYSGAFVVECVAG